MPGAGYYRQYAAISSLFFTINVLGCAACSLVTASYKPLLKATIRAGGKGRILVCAMSLSAQLLFLSGVLFFFLVMQLAQLVVCIVGMVFTSLAIVTATYVWVVELKNCDKGISLPEEA